MGVSSNLEVFLSEKNLNDHTMGPDSSFLVRPTIATYQECQASTQEDHEVRPKQQELMQERHQEQDQEDHQVKRTSHNVPALPAAPLGLNLKLEIPSYKEAERDEEHSNAGFKTPTSPEHKIPAILPCPPAPRKPKTLPSTKRKGCCRCQIEIDLTSQEIESLFPTQLAVDLGAGANNKKVKLFTESYNHGD